MIWATVMYARLQASRKYVVDLQGQVAALLRHMDRKGDGSDTRSQGKVGFHHVLPPKNQFSAATRADGFAAPAIRCSTDEKI